MRSKPTLSGLSAEDKKRVLVESGAEAGGTWYTDNAKGDIRNSPTRLFVLRNMFRAARTVV